MLIKKLPLITLLCIVLILPVLIDNATAQAEPNYYVTITPIIPENSSMYTTVGHNWTLTFTASWSYNSDSEKQIKNASVTIEVKNSQKVLEELSLNTTSGTFTFNYSSNEAGILTFTPTSLTTQNNDKYSAEVIDSTNNLYGLNGASVVVWWDTFHVSLLSYDTSILENTAVTVNVTYLLLPEEGLNLPEWATYSNQTFLPKIINDATVRINGVVAQETDTAGVFRANSSILMPTAYINVDVSQEGWTTTHTAFGFAHNANRQVWFYGIVFASVVTFVVLIIHTILSRKAGASSFKISNFPFFGAVFLMVTSFISLYWGVVSLEGVLHTFDWLAFTALCLLSFVFGFFSSLMILRRKYQVAAIFTVSVPLIVNTFFVKVFLDMSQLANPWLVISLSVVLSILSTFFICNSDNAFEKKTLEDDNVVLV